MATARGLTLQESLILLVMQLSSNDFQHITLTHQVNISRGNTKKWKAEILTVANSHDVEYLLHAVIEFQCVAIKEHLSLTTGPNLYSYF